MLYSYAHFLKPESCCFVFLISCIVLLQNTAHVCSVRYHRPVVWKVQQGFLCFDQFVQSFLKISLESQDVSFRIRDQIVQTAPSAFPHVLFTSCAPCWSHEDTQWWQKALSNNHNSVIKVYLSSAYRVYSAVQLRTSVSVFLSSSGSGLGVSVNVEADGCWQADWLLTGSKSLCSYDASVSVQRLVHSPMETLNL